MGRRFPSPETDSCLRDWPDLDWFNSLEVFHGAGVSAAGFSAKPTTWSRRTLAGPSLGTWFDPPRRASGERPLVEEAAEFRILAATKPASRVRNEERGAKRPQAIYPSICLWL